MSSTEKVQPYSGDKQVNNNDEVYEGDNKDVRSLDA